MIFHIFDKAITNITFPSFNFTTTNDSSTSPYYKCYYWIIDYVFQNILEFFQAIFWITSLCILTKQMSQLTLLNYTSFGSTLKS